jgi:hypothetical protein
MKKLVLFSMSAIALLGIAACSDSGGGGADTTTTQGINPPAQEEPVPAQPGTDGNGTMQPAQPSPATPAPQQ